MILPFSPEPFTVARSIPLSSASLLANGEAKILPFELEAFELEVELLVFASTVLSVTSSFFCSDFGASFFGGLFVGP